MHPDKIFVRILLIFSVANVAIAAPAAVRQRYLDVAKAASEKRAQGSDDVEMGNLPPESSPPMAPHGDRPTDMSRWAWLLWPDPPDSSPASDNRITTQASGASGSGNGATGNLPPASLSPTPPHDGPADKWAWLYRASLPESSSAAENRITTQASGASGSGNGATGDLPPMPPHDSRPTNEGLDRPSSPVSSASSSDRVASQASGATTLSSPNLSHLEDTPPPISPADTLAAPEVNQPLRESLTHKIVPFLGPLGVTLLLVATGIHLYATKPYVSLLCPLSPADIYPSHKHSDL